MPKMRIMAPQPGDFPNDASNFYYCSSQAVFVKSGGDPYDAVNIANLYGVSLGPFTTSYAWYSNSGMTTPITPPSGSNGSYTFPSSMLGNTIYCKVKNPLFSLKTSDRSFVPFPGYKYSTEYPYNSLYDYGEEFYAPNYIASYAGECDLVLCYQTTLGLPTSITNPTAPSLIAYFSGEMLNITNNEISLQSVSIFDLSGKQLFASNFNDTGITVDGAGWQKGVYIIKATSDAGVFTQKIIKNF